jgi:hypothetical protein
MRPEIKPYFVTFITNILESLKRRILFYNNNFDLEKYIKSFDTQPKGGAQPHSITVHPEDPKTKKTTPNDNESVILNNSETIFTQFLASQKKS